MFKKIATASFAAMVFLLALSACNIKAQEPSKFSDISQPFWASKEIGYLKDKSLISGYEDGTFRPQKEATRAEVVAMLVNAKKDIVHKTEAELPFKDVPVGYWGREAIEAAYRSGLLSGYPDGTFRPDQSISRAEIATLLAKEFSLKRKGGGMKFQDVDATNWARDAIEIVASNHIAVGDSEGIFDPGKPVTRAELAAFLARTLDESFRPGSVPERSPAPSTTPTPASAAAVYRLELARWNISNNGTNALQTTIGINKALQWAHDNGYTEFQVPSGTYLISKGADTVDSKRINMVSNMTVHLDDDAVFQKETNGLEEYTVFYVGPNTENVTIKGGTLLGDRDTHDYSQKQTEAGTHEWGYGVNVAGGRNITIEGMNIQKFTGDGIVISGSTMSGGGTLSRAAFESGGLDDQGRPIAQTGKIRSVGRTYTNFDKIKEDIHKVVNMWLPQGLSSKDFYVCYYRKDNSFISCDTGRIYSKYSMAPADADYYRIVFDAPGTADVKVSWMVIDNAKGVVIQNNDIGFNRRQGITAGGEDVQIINNKIHDTHGTAPQSGIDIEPGFYPARNFLIKGNDIYNNKIQSVLAYGDQATFEDNHFKQDGSIAGSIGLFVYPAFTNVKVNHNVFENTGLTLQSNYATANDNQFLNGSASLQGSFISSANGTFTDSSLSLGDGEGIVLTDTTILNSGADPAHKGSLTIGKKPVNLKSITLKGTPTSKIAISGYASKDSVYDHLVVIDGESGATGLPSGTYKDSSFTYTGDKTSGYGIQYGSVVTMDHSTFKNTTLSMATNTTELTVQHSNFTFDGDLNAPAIYVPEGKNVTVTDNIFTAMNLTGTTKPIIKLGQFAWKTHPAKVLGGEINGNVIHTNANPQVKGIDTTDAGIGAPIFKITDNTMYNAVLNVNPVDLSANNQELPQ